MAICSSVASRNHWGHSVLEDNDDVDTCVCIDGYLWASSPVWLQQKQANHSILNVVSNVRRNQKCLQWFLFCNFLFFRLLILTAAAGWIFGVFCLFHFLAFRHESSNGLRVQKFIHPPRSRKTWTGPFIPEPVWWELKLAITLSVVGFSNRCH